MTEVRRPRPADRLSVERVLDAAITLADRVGLDSMSMRLLGDELGADPMAVYHYFRDKRSLLAAMADQVVEQIEPTLDGAWPDALRATIHSARAAMLDHPWVSRVLVDTPTPGPATLAYLNAIFGILRNGGLSIALTHHAIHVLGSRVLGFSQDLFDDRTPPPMDDSARSAQADAWAVDLPWVAEMARAAEHDGGLGGCDDDAEFAFGLDIVIEGLQRRSTVGV